MPPATANDLSTTAAARQTDDGIGHAIARAEIPRMLADRPVIGHGATSLVVAVDDRSAIMLTRDAIKAAWLVEIGRATLVGEARSRHPSVSALSRFPILTLAMERLQPLDAGNRQAARALVHAYSDASLEAWRRHRDLGDQRRAIRSHFVARPEHGLHRLFAFLKRYRWYQYDLDLRLDLENFMQDRAGALVILDPVITGRLQTVLERFRPAA